MGYYYSLMSVRPGKSSEDTWGMYDIVVNSVPGVISILIFLLLLPTNIIDIRSFIYQADSLLYSLTFAIIFAVLGYVVSILLNSFLPSLPTFLWTYYYQLPFMPSHSPRLRPAKEYRYTEAVEALFDYDQFQSLGKGLQMSQRYLEFKGVKNIHHSDNLKSVFTQLWEVSVYATLIVFFFARPSLSPIYFRTHDLVIDPTGLLVLGVLISSLSSFLVWRTPSIDEHLYIKDIFRSLYYYLPLLYIGNWLVGIQIMERIGIKRIPLNYGYYIGGEIVPILFVLSLIFFKTRREYEEELVAETFRTLYAVAMAEEDI